MKHFVYLIQSIRGGAIKIGRSYDPDEAIYDEATLAELWKIERYYQGVRQKARFGK